MTDDLHEIMRILGRLEEGQERQRADFETEQEHTREARQRTYEKLEKIDVDVSIVGKVAAQARQEAADARDKAAAVEKVVVEDVKPTTDEIKRMRQRGIGALWAVGVVATLFGATISDVLQSLIKIVMGWLNP